MHAPHPHAPAALHLEETHPFDGILAVATLILGLGGLLMVGLNYHRVGMVMGAVGVLGGLTGQMFSRTRAERFSDVIGLVAAAVAFAVGAALGGLSFTG